MPGMEERDSSSGIASGITPYAWFALAVLALASFINYLDRMIFSILARSMKVDLNLTDAQLGFLMGTGFAVFYSIVGIGMGRIADVIHRGRLMALGLTAWSLMTALGSLATGFAGLAASRIGVGIGEATASPSSYSLISQYFPSRHRALAVGIYMIGVFLGSAAAMALGGLLLQHWPNICMAAPIPGVCGLKGWQATLIVVGLAGLPLALLVYRLREPERQGKEEISLISLLTREAGAALPPLTLITLFRLGGRQPFFANLRLAFVIIALGAIMAWSTGDHAQWWAIALGAYSIITWAGIQKWRDPLFYRLTFGSPTYMLTTIAAATAACVTSSVTAWSAPFAIRELGMPPASAGVSLGLAIALSSGIGAVLSGALIDRWKLRDACAPMWLTAIAMVLTIPAVATMVTAANPSTFVLSYTVFGIATSSFSPALIALTLDLVQPQMRGAASSAFSLTTVLVAAGAGPYLIGKVSTVTGSLTVGLISIEALVPLTLVLLWIAARQLRAVPPSQYSFFTAQMQGVT